MNEENIGWRKNFIEGLKRARGEYIFFADQDDIWIKDKIEKIVKTMEANKKIEVLAHNYDNFFEEGYYVTDNYALNEKIHVDSRLLSESKKYSKYYPKLLSFVADLFSH